MVTFIPATQHDVDFVYKCITELENFVFKKEKFIAIFDGILSNQKAFPFVITYNSEKVGYLSIHIQTLLHHCGDVAEIQELIILPEYRNLKCGKQAIIFAKEFAKEKKCDLLELSSKLIRKDAHRFYLNNAMNQTHYKFTFPLTDDGIQK
ncbi:MAG: GNAT family N-acetyltransferase [Bacteroidia bacterium]